MIKNSFLKNVNYYVYLKKRKQHLNIDPKFKEPCAWWTSL